MRLALLLWLAAAARADTIYLANGNQLEGRVVSQTLTQLTLDIGYGSTVLDKADIVKIRRSGNHKGRSEAEKELQRRQFDSGLVVPPGAANLDALFRGVQSRREKALEGRARTAELDDEMKAILEEIPRLKAAYGGLSAELQGNDAGSNGRAHNRLIGEINKTGVKLNADHLRLEEIARLKKENEEGVHDYLDSYRRLEDYVAGEGATLIRKDADYFAWLREELKTMAADFVFDTIVPERKGDALFVQVRLNEAVTARMLVDTGASTTLLYKEVADRLNLSPEARIGTARATVADGRSVDAQLVRLASVAVGRSEVKGSAAAVVPISGMGFDGLLGMSFLGHFIARVDAANGRLVLEDLKRQDPR